MIFNFFKFFYSIFIWHFDELRQVVHEIYVYSAIRVKTINKLFRERKSNQCTAYEYAYFLKRKNVTHNYNLQLVIVALGTVSTVWTKPDLEV